MPNAEPWEIRNEQDQRQLEKDFIEFDKPHNANLIALQDAAYNLGLTRGRQQTLEGLGIKERE